MNATGKMVTFPCRSSSGSMGCITPGRTVAIWGRWSLQRITAIRLPPKAGRVIISSLVSGSMARPVQSAVRPVLIRADRRGARSRPMEVAPKRTISGSRARITSVSALA